MRTADEAALRDLDSQTFLEGMKKMQQVVGDKPGNPFAISDEMIGDIATAALDPGYGGSEYWSERIRMRWPTEITHRDFESSDGMTYVGEFLLNGGGYAIGERGDLDDPDEIPWHPLDKEIMRAGVVRACAFYRQTPEQFYENHDAASADVALQLAVLGEIIYG